MWSLCLMGRRVLALEHPQAGDLKGGGVPGPWPRKPET